MRQRWGCRETDRGSLAGVVVCLQGEKVVYQKKGGRGKEGGVGFGTRENKARGGTE